MVAEQRSVLIEREGVARYVTTLIAALLVPTALVVAANVVIDPLLLRWPRPAWLPEPAFIQFDREVHSNLVAHVRPRSLILGNSQTQHGIAPKDWSAPPPIVNAGIVGADLREIRRALRTAQEAGPVAEALLGLDFALAKARVGTPPETNDDYLVSSTGAMRAANLRGSVSFALFRTSASLVANAVRGVAYFGPGGQALDRLYADSTGAAGGTRAALAQRLGQFTANLRAGPNDFDEQLRGLRDEACRGGTRLRVYLTPLHAVWLGAIAEAGQTDAWEAWKRSIASIGAERSDCGFEVWDFNTVNPLTTEALPGAGVKDGLRASWDGVHFKPWVGARILERMGQGTSDPDGFGVRLTPATVDEALARDRQAAERFRAGKDGAIRTEDILRRHTSAEP